MLQVFSTAKEREVARAKIVKTVYGDYSPSGITPPTHDVVRRRFELTRSKGDNSYLPYKVKQVCEEIARGVETVVGNSAIAPRDAAEAAEEVKTGSEVVLESVEEEVVDFQEWMADPARPGYGVCVTLCGADWSSEDAQFLQRYPEALLTEVEAEEDAVDQLAMEQLRVDRERLEASSASFGGSTAANPPVAAIAASGTTDIVVSNSSLTSGAAVDSSVTPIEAADDTLKISLKIKSVGSESGGVGLAGQSHLSPSHSANADEDLMMAAEDEEQEEPANDEDQDEEMEEEGEEEFADEEEEEWEENRTVPPVVATSEEETEQVTEETAPEEEAHEVSGQAQDETAALSDNAEEEEDDDDWMNNV